MPPPDTQTASLRDSVLGNISNFLVNEGFSFQEAQHLRTLKDGILAIIDQLADYREEGTSLFPEMIISTDFEALIQTFPTMARLDISTGGVLSVKGITKSLKLCAPLATEGWIIYLNLKGGLISFGVINGNLSETSASIFDQLVANQEELETDFPYAYIRNLGYKNVQLVGRKNALQVEFSLKDFSTHQDDYVEKLCETICSEVENNLKETAITFFRKTITNANRVGHGTLIGVIDTGDDSLVSLNEHIKDGTILTQPVDLIEQIQNAIDENSAQASAALKAYSCLITGMINSDGITLFTNTGQLVGFHVFIKLSESSKATENGGARTKAFESMRDCKGFNCCFFKSQDGNEKIDTNDG